MWWELGNLKKSLPAAGWGPTGSCLKDWAPTNIYVHLFFLNLLEFLFHSTKFGDESCTIIYWGLHQSVYCNGVTCCHDIVDISGTFCISFYAFFFLFCLLREMPNGLALVNGLGRDSSTFFWIFVVIAALAAI